MSGIIWLASYPKSGNTWLRAFLHNLLLNPDAPLPPDALNRVATGDHDIKLFETVAGRSLADEPDETLYRLIPETHRYLAHLDPAQPIFVKTHHYLGMAQGVPLVTMQWTTGAIYVVRDPRDVAISFADHYGLTMDRAIASMNDPTNYLLRGPHNMAQHLKDWSSHVQSWTHKPNPRLHVVRYEDMLAKPGPTFKKIAHFLGLDPAADQLTKAIRFSSFKELRKQEEEKGFSERTPTSRRFFRKGETGQWRTGLSLAQRQAIESAHGATMKRFGYL